MKQVIFIVFQILLSGVVFAQQPTPKNMPVQIYFYSPDPMNYGKGSGDGSFANPYTSKPPAGGIVFAQGFSGLGIPYTPPQTACGTDTLSITIANSSINVALPTYLSEQPAVLNIYNLSGKLLKTLSIDKEQSTANIATTDLPNGIYLVSYIADGITLSSAKVVVQH